MHIRPLVAYTAVESWERGNLQHTVTILVVSVLDGFQIRKTELRTECHCLVCKSRLYAVASPSYFQSTRRNWRFNTYVYFIGNFWYVRDVVTVDWLVTPILQVSERERTGFKLVSHIRSNRLYAGVFHATVHLVFWLIYAGWLPSQQASAISCGVKSCEKHMTGGITSERATTNEKYLKVALYKPCQVVAMGRSGYTA